MTKINQYFQNPHYVKATIFLTTISKRLKAQENRRRVLESSTTVSTRVSSPYVHGAEPAGFVTNLLVEMQLEDKVNMARILKQS